MTVFTIAPVVAANMTAAAAKFATQVAQRIVGDTTYVKHLSVQKIEQGIDDQFIDRRTVPIIANVTVTDRDGIARNANLYAMRTESKLRGTIPGVAVYVHQRGWYYDEEISPIGFDELLKLVKSYASVDTTAGIDNWLASDAFPAYVNKAVEQSAVH